MKRIAMSLLVGVTVMASAACHHDRNRSTNVGGGPSGQESYSQPYSGPGSENPPGTIQRNGGKFNSPAAQPQGATGGGPVSTTGVKPIDSTTPGTNTNTMQQTTPGTNTMPQSSAAPGSSARPSGNWYDGAMCSTAHAWGCGCGRPAELSHREDLVLAHTVSGLDLGDVADGLLQQRTTDR